MKKNSRLPIGNMKLQHVQVTPYSKKLYFIYYEDRTKVNEK